MPSRSASPLFLFARYRCFFRGRWGRARAFAVGVLWVLALFATQKAIIYSAPLGAVLLLNALQRRSRGAPARVTRPLAAGLFADCARHCALFRGDSLGRRFGSSKLWSGRLITSGTIPALNGRFTGCPRSKARSSCSGWGCSERAAVRLRSSCERRAARRARSDLAARAGKLPFFLWLRACAVSLCKVARAWHAVRVCAARPRGAPRCDTSLAGARAVAGARS